MDGLSRSDLASVGPVSGKNTLKVLPFSKSRRQKLVIGDDFGQLTCLQAKRGETSTVFKTRLSEEGNPITCVALNNETSGEKIYASQGRQVHGVNRKGKEFCTIPTKLSETIQNLAVREKQLWVSGELTYASYMENDEVDYIKCEDPISSMVVAREGDFVLLGIGDHSLRVVKNGQFHTSLDTSGGISALEEYASPFHSSSKAHSSQLFMYGTGSGAVGLVEMHSDTQSLRRMWESEQEEDSTVNCLAAYDLTKDDVEDILVGRSDGRVQVYKVRDEEGTGLEEKNRAGKSASLQFEQFVDESVRSIQGGVVSSPGYDELVVCTFAGNLVSFTTEALDQVEDGDKKGRSKAAVGNEGRVKQMEEEIASLQQQIETTKAKIVKVRGPQIPSEESSLGFQRLQVNHKVALLREEAVFVLSIELPLPIDSVILQSSSPLTLLDKDENGESRGQSVVISSFSDASRGLQAVYRCTESAKRVEVRFKAVEGQAGQIQVTVVAKVQPKIARQVTIDVKPLCLHYRVPAAPESADLNVFSHVQFSGEFSLYQVHDWIGSCFPDVPQNVPSLSQEESAELWFCSSLVKSFVKVSYRQGFAMIESDSISSIAIVREAFSTEANKRKAKLNIKFSINPSSVPYFLKVVDEEFREQAKLSQKVEILQALQEISNGEEDTSFLSKEHRSLLKNSKNLEHRFERKPHALQTLHGIIYDLYVDVQKFQGRDVRNRGVHEKLMHILEHYDFNTLSAFFSQ